MREIRSVSIYFFKTLLLTLTLVLFVGTIGMASASPEPAPILPASPLVGEDACLPTGYSCTANDVRIRELAVVEVIESCPAGDPTTAVVRFRAFISAEGSPDRYDIGLYFSRNGNSVQGNTDCYHDYFEGPITTTPTYGDYNGDTVLDIFKNYPVQGGFIGLLEGEGKNADACGDIASNTQVFKVLDTGITIQCVDTIDSLGNPTPDGFVDIDTCASWDNNAVTTCNGVWDAVAGTGAKCSCARQNTTVPMNPTAVTMGQYGAISGIGQVRVFWETALELDAIGFNLYRATDPDGMRVQHNSELIPSQVFGGLVGASYEFIDRDIQAGQTYYYWLEFIDIEGKTIFGPMQAMGEFGIYLPMVTR